MAHATLWDSPCPLRRVLLVTVQTAYLCFVFRSAGCYCLRLLGVAQDTLGVGQSWDCRGSCLIRSWCWDCSRGSDLPPLLTGKSADQSDHTDDTDENTRQFHCSQATE
jgi:hypothetical protein